MILIVEPTYGEYEHAPVNVALLQALAACGRVQLAATQQQAAAMQEAAPHGVATQFITVLPPGGVHFRRMAAQWRTLNGLVQQHRPCTLVLLSAGPETMFVMRALVTRHRGLRIFAVMHGNLSGIVGWRSRDPRRRAIDLVSGLRVARHPRIRLIVLEQGIADAARRYLPHDLLVWPYPILPSEVAEPAAWIPAPRLRLVFPGTASPGKGFDTVRAWCANAPNAYDWSVAGRPTSAYTAREMAGFEMPRERLSRSDYLAALRRSDYAVVSLGPEYELTASGSLLDCLAQQLPLISVDNSTIGALTRQYGPFGHVLPDMAAVQALLATPERLLDAGEYAGFRRSMAAAARDRLPKAIETIVRHDVGRSASVKV